AQKQFKVQPELTRSAIRESEANYNAAMSDCNQLKVATIPQAKAQAKASYDQAMADQRNYGKNLERQKALLAKGYVPESDVDNVRQQYENAQAAVSQAKARLDTIDLQYKAAVLAAEAKCEQAHAQLATAKENRMLNEIKQRDWEAAVAAVEH